MADIFVQRRENFLSLADLIRLTCATNHKNSFFLFELSQTISELEMSGFIRRSGWVESDSSWPLFLAVKYLTGYLDDQHRLGDWVHLPDDYLSASIRCSSYLQSSIS